MKYTCPCCGYKTLNEEPPGNFQICEICFWEDDYTQFDDPDYEGDANAPSLKQAQRNFILVGACEEEFVEHVRKPNEKDLKDPRWKRIV
ncbi:CPCC family cysteine-rich protein [Virgibacillus dokdonensis]|uniref:CPCC family cysteine-rich protein n=1 Tax=Virgibacillus dokdonensis TaxID=302167 RepID=UPI00098AB666|nr:CPCC family cysteine-rich protein [Virgibacillus dokdonensis]